MVGLLSCTTLQLSSSLFSLQIQLGAANHLFYHATGQWQRRARALPRFHFPHNDPTQYLHHASGPVNLPQPASGLSALRAAPAAPAVLSGT